MKTRKFVPYVRIAALVAGALGINVGLHAAGSFTPNNQPTGWLTPPALSTGWLKQDDTLNPDGGGFAYVPWFENSAWQGDLVEWTVTANGERSTSVVNDTPPTNTAATNWSAREQFASTIATTPDWWDSGRKIITWNGSAQKAFRWSSLTVDQKGTLDSATYTADSSATVSPILNYVRGDTSQATENGGLYPNRWSLLRDIQHSNPVYVGPPKGRYTITGYSTFKSDYASRTPRVYVGANDGMLHVFNVDTGDEVYAYVPSMLYGNLDALTVVPYAHTYFVDGPLASGDAQVGSGSDWKTVLVGGLGAGGKGVFVLDITDADLDAEDAIDADDQKVLFEMDSTHTTVGNDLGYTYSKAVISKLPDGDWYAVMGNGYNSSNGIAKLILINLRTWDVTSISTGSGSSGSPNGLSTPALVDTATSGADYMADYAYAGDIDGNVWKFDLDTKTLSYKLISAGATKPITTAPDLVSYRGGYLVYFGTGRILTDADLANTDAQSIFAVLDSGAAVAESDLQTQTLTETTYTGITPNPTVRYATDTAIDWSTKKGWMVNLPLSGERLVTDLQVRAERVQFVTTDPTHADLGDDPAVWLMELNYQTGGSPDSVIIDLNEDSYLTTADNVNGADSDSTDVVDRVVGVQRRDGVSSQPVFAIIDEVGGGTIDTFFINNMLLPVVDECTVNCVDGFITGSIDVMTDSPYGPLVGTSSDDVTVAHDGLGGFPNGHQHVYDKVHGTVFVDLLGPASLNNTPTSRADKLEPRRNLVSLDARSGVSTATQHLNSVEEVYRASGGPNTFDTSTEFFVVVTNADLNTGGTLTIGDNPPWNVLDYQNMITPQLIALAGATATTSNLKDGTIPLVFRLSDIMAADGTIRVSFSSTDIRSGLIIPTRPQCVSGATDWNLATAASAAVNKHITPVGSGSSQDGSADVGYRWRNGALTIQLIKASGYTLQPANNGLSGSNKKYLLPHSRQGSTYTLVGGIHAKEYTVDGSSVMSFAEGADESGLLYEAAIFWHYGDYALYDVGGFASCYGASNWQASRGKELDGVNFAKYSAALDGLTSSSDEIERYFRALAAKEECQARSSCDNTEMTAAITELHAAILDVSNWERLRSYVPNSIATRGDNSGILDEDLALETAITDPPADESSDPPDALANNLDSRWKTDGPNFVRGRRTWTELIRSQ